MLDVFRRFQECSQLTYLLPGWVELYLCGFAARGGHGQWIWRFLEEWWVDCLFSTSFIGVESEYRYIGIAWESGPPPARDACIGTHRYQVPIQASQAGVGPDSQAIRRFDGGSYPKTGFVTLWNNQEATGHRWRPAACFLDSSGSQAVVQQC